MAAAGDADLYGDADADQIFGDDRLEGGSGQDYLEGGGGDEFYAFDGEHDSQKVETGEFAESDAGLGIIITC